MTYRELMYKAIRLIDKGEIDLGEYEEMTKPLDREVEQKPCEDCVSRHTVLDLLKGIEILHNHDELRSNLICGIMDIPPVTPQYTDAEIQKMQEMEQAEIQKAYELGKEDKIKVLDKIRAEIEKEIISGDSIDYINGLNMALMIINEKCIGKEKV